jgi:hypothetical protein
MVQQISKRKFLVEGETDCMNIISQVEQAEIFNEALLKLNNNRCYKIIVAE